MILYIKHQVVKFRHWSTWPKPGKWSWLKYSYITSDNNAYKTTCNAESEVYISEVLESVHYSRETTRFPTKSTKDGTIQVRIDFSFLIMIHLHCKSPDI